MQSADAAIRGSMCFIVFPFSFLVETVESDFIREGCNPFQIRATHRAVLYVS
ncbi:hypothetical protein NMH_2420 [Neisseria meningitidis H44/76]|uniref:Uncharacterized protein n=1 Tax=Neisseria meningitidis serogroup B / serotype 15 (strain H44/76) TaxID=909420 RepID=E6N0C5_NEIMH|nr:hypothetical protein NMH_2420 [Neisseria meningitidis H44/76]